MAQVLTDTQLARVPALAGLEPEIVQQVLADAEAIYATAQEGDGADEAVLRARCEHAGIDPDRYNRAIKLLQEQGRVAVVDASALPPLPPPEKKRGTRRRAKGKGKK